MKEMTTVLSLLAALLLAQNIFAEEIVFVGGDYAPFVISPSALKDSDSQGRGILLDLLIKFSKENPEYHIIHKQYPSARATWKMQRGEVDISYDSPIFVKEGILDLYDFTDTVAHTEDVVVTRKDRNFTFNKAEDLYGMEIATIIGFKYGEFDDLEKQGKIKYHKITEQRQAVLLLNAKRVDACFGNIHVTPYYMKLHNLNIADFRFSKKKMFEFDLAYLVNKKTNLLPKLNAFIQKSKDDGTLQAITNNYIK